MKHTYCLEAVEATPAPLEIKSAREIREVLTTPLRYSGTMSFEFKDADEMERARAVLDRAIREINHPGRWSPTPPTESGIFWYRIPGRGERLLVDYDHTKGSFEQWGAGFQQTHEETDGEFWSERLQEPPA